MKKTVVLALLALGTGAYAQKSQPSEVQVNTPTPSVYPNEPSICINKAEPNTLIAGANINNHYLSLDNGKTWENKTIESTFGVWGDPVLHSDANGTIYFVHLSRTPGKSKDYSFIDRIVIQTSSDGGKTFENGSFTGLNEPKMQDKPWISTDDYSEKMKGNAYLTWTEFDKINSKKKKHQSRIRFSSSSDQGKTWSEAITISDSVGDAVDDDHTLEGATTAVDTRGNIYCVWAGHNRLYFDKSTDGGKTWGMDRVIFGQQSGWAMDVPHVYRTNGMPFLVIDNSNGEYTGRMYLVWGDDKLGDADVFISYSDDEGDTWSVPKTVHHPLMSQGKSQYMPNMAIDPVTGHVAVVYYDRRNSRNNVFNDVYVSVSKDGGEHFRGYRMNEILSNHIGEDAFSGDYIDVDFYNGKITAIWSGYDGEAKVYNRTLTEEDLENISPIHKVGQLHLFHSKESRLPVIYGVATVPCDVKVTYYRKPWFSKNLKEKSVEEFGISHKPGLDGYGETRIEARQKKHIKVEAVITDKAVKGNKTKTLWIK